MDDLDQNQSFSGTDQPKTSVQSERNQDSSGLGIEGKTNYLQGLQEPLADNVLERANQLIAQYVGLVTNSDGDDAAALLLGDHLQLKLDPSIDSLWSKLDEPDISSPSRSLIIIDTAVKDWRELVVSAPETAEILILDTNKDGLLQIAEHLNQQQASGAIGFGSLAIVSESSEGQLQLGNSHLGPENLEAYREILSQWHRGLTNDADISLYGSNASENAYGSSFFENFIALAHGNSQLGGDLQREVDQGPIEAEVSDKAPFIRLYPADLLDSRQLMAASTGHQLADSAQKTWQKALASVNQTLTSFANQANFNPLIEGVFGTTGNNADQFNQHLAALESQLTGDGLGLTVELRNNDELSGAAGAYTAVGHTGSERIYVNGDWISNGASSFLIRQVLLEEIGHAIDRRLNGSHDGKGDEGELFAKLLTREQLTEAERAAIQAEGDSAVLTIEGVQVLVERSLGIPTLSPITINNAEDTPLVFTAEVFKNAYSSTTNSSLTSITIETLPATGVLKLSGADVSSGQVIATGNLGNLSYVPAANENGVKTFTATASDGLSSSSPATIVSINISAINDAPVATGTTKTLNQGAILSFSATDFASSDVDSSGSSDTGLGKSLQTVKIISLPANGSLWLDSNGNNTKDSGESISANQEIGSSDLGNLRFTPNNGFSGSTSFSWNGSDGLSYGSSAVTTTLTVTALSDTIPSLTSSSGRTLVVRPSAGGAVITPVVVDPGLRLVDSDATLTSQSSYDTIRKASLSLVDQETGSFVSGDVLAATGISGKINTSYDASKGLLTLSGDATAAEYQQVLRTLTFATTNTSNNHQRSINVILTSSSGDTRQALHLDGVDDYVETLRPSVPMAGDWTISVWAQADGSITAGGNNNSYTIVAQGGGVANEGVSIKKTGTADLRIGELWTITGAMPSDGGWHQYTLIKSGTGATNGTLYIDGVRQGSGQISDAIGGTGLRIGRDYRINDSSDQNNYWKGAISDLRVWDRTLTMPEVGASLDRNQTLSGYEANLVAWYALAGDTNNRATGHWNLGRDYDPRATGVAQGVWNLGVMNTTSADAFTAVAGLASFDRDGTGTRSVSSNGELISVYADGASYSDWGSISFIPNSSNNYTNGSASYRPGEVTFTPGSRYPGVAEFTAPTDGVYGIDARFWKTRPETSTNYKLFKVTTNGTISELDSGGAVTGTAPGSANRSNLEQILLNQGEKLLFAVHKGGAASTNLNDETSASLNVDLLASKVVSGGKDYYYNLATGHYIGLTTGAANWNNAKNEAGNLVVAGQKGYLSTPADSTSTKISRALLSSANISQAWTGSQSIGGDFYWSTGPLQGQSISAGGNSLTISGYNNNAITASQRYLVEFGSNQLTMPSGLSSALNQAAVAGNALIINQAGLAYSPVSGHYYKTDTTVRTFNDAISNAETTSVQGQAGYLTRLDSLQELEIAGWFARQNNQANLWLGLYQTDTSNEPDQGWQWISGDGAGMASDLNYNNSGYQSWLPGQPDGNNPTITILSEDYNSSRAGWTNGSITNFGLETVLGQFGTTENSDTTLSLTNTHSRVSFELWQIDSWENEFFKIYINDNLLFTSPGLTGGSSSLLSTPYSGSSTINGKTVNFTMLGATTSAQVGGSSVGDQKFTVSIDLPKDFGSTIKLKVDSTLDQASSDESWALDNLTIQQGFEDAGSLGLYGAGLQDKLETVPLGSLVEYGIDGSRLTAPTVFQAPAALIQR